MNTKKEKPEDPARIKELKRRQSAIGNEINEFKLWRTRQSGQPKTGKSCLPVLLPLMRRKKSSLQGKPVQTYRPFLQKAGRTCYIWPSPFTRHGTEKRRSKNQKNHIP